jgi:hypothetical protein
VRSGSADADARADDPDESPRIVALQPSRSSTLKRDPDAGEQERL